MHAFHSYACARVNILEHWNTPMKTKNMDWNTNWNTDWNTAQDWNTPFTVPPMAAGTAILGRAVALH